MDDPASEEAPREVAPSAPATGTAPAWPSPPPRTVEHAVALLATTWTRARGAA